MGQKVVKFVRLLISKLPECITCIRLRDGCESAAQAIETAEQ